MVCIRMAILALVLVLLLSNHPAAAFSTEKGSDVFQGNASNFTDPDEKQPPFLQMQGGNQLTGSQSQQQTESVDPGADRERYMGLSSSFDHAYQHQSQ